ncbi:hypothetical protein [Peribacillus frigoritolerans]|uniref:hypothetical protein n=1 Tax=Peribacillus frigoritolerans TaxID=450367 RepID=UPI0031E0E515
MIGTEGTRLLREKRVEGHHTVARTARGKRVPGVEIITHTLFQKSARFSPTEKPSPYSEPHLISPN